MDIQVNDCTDCPFNVYEYDSCGLSNILGKYLTTPYGGVPKECPLLKEPVTVSYGETHETQTL
jgi:hypothetical protein